MTSLLSWVAVADAKATYAVTDDMIAKIVAALTAHGLIASA